VSLTPFLAAGLLKKRPESEGYYDTFRNRLIFPILDQAGRAIAFGARIINPEDEPKYLNSPESPLFLKGATLFGLRQAARPIQEARRAIVTEGYTDVIACHQAGVRNVVATLGTALTEKHATVLRRLCDEIILLFDGDEAGQRAADRAFEVFFAQPVDVRVVLLPGNQDPADYLATPEGAQEFSRLMDAGTDLLAFRFDRMTSALEARGQAPGSAGRARAVEETITRLVELGLGDLPIIRRRTIVRRLARIAGVDERTIMDAIDASRPRARRAPQDGSGEESAIAAPTRPTDPAQHALACLLAEPGLVGKFPELAADILDPAVYGFGHARTVAQTLAHYANREGELSLSALLLEFEEPETRTLATGFAAEAERIAEHDPEKIEQRFVDCARRHSKERLFLRGDSASGIDRILEVREAHRRLGGNPASVPKPMV
jgi:DNA primase